MQEKVKAVRLSVSAELAAAKHTLKEAFRVSKPYIAGGVVMAMVAGAGITSALKLGSKEDLIANSMLVAVPVGAKVFKEVQRNSRHMSALKRIGTIRLPASEQNDIVVNGTFEEKSALLTNLHITPRALAAIRNDTEFREHLLLYLQNARENLSKIEPIVFQDPQNSYYRYMAKEIGKRIDLYEHNERVLFAERELKPMARPEQLTLVA